MGLENANFILELDENWPLSQDFRREGDDHLRLIKRTLKATFPNCNGPIQASDAELNTLAGVNTDETIQEQLDGKLGVGGTTGLASLTANNTFQRAQAVQVQSLTITGNTALDGTLSNLFQVTVNNNIGVFDIATQPGMVYNVLFINNGSYTVGNFGSIDFPYGNLPQLTPFGRDHLTVIGYPGARVGFWAEDIK